MAIDAPILICMDLQQEFIAPGRPFADPEGDEIAAICQNLIEQARAAGWTVLHTHLHQGGSIIAGHGLTQPIAGCEPLAGEILLRRAGVSAYAHPDLDEILANRHDDNVYLIGFSGPLSLTQTLFDAQDRGHQLQLVQNAVGGADVGEWSADETRALVQDTARKLSRLCPLDSLHQALDPGFSKAARA